MSASSIDIRKREVEPVVLNRQGLIPINYDLEIDTNISNPPYFYTGKVDIDFQLTLDDLKELSFHAKEIHLNKVTIVYVGPSVDAKAASEVLKPNSSITPSRIEVDIEETVVTLSKFSTLGDNALPKGIYKATFDFVGEHNNQMTGFYRSSYTDAKGEKKLMISTFFAPLDARRCFPCIDEPAAKATFSASLIVDSHLTAISNMPVGSEAEVSKGRKKITYKPSPKMSTYLLAFAVGEFDYVESKTKSGVVVRVYTPPARSEMGKYALEIGVKSLDFYDGMFGKPYPLPKMDMIAIPEFAMGAMENWGLVTYREVDLLIDFARASSQQRQRVCTIVAHELAHQWFGNLVTMEWWDDLWLNEGFASWMQVYAANDIYPDWDMWTQFVNSEQASALRLDALVTSHPVQVPIRRAQEVEQVFDTISYCKGACVVRIVHAFLGDELFKKGLCLYMSKYAYQNTRTIDLWSTWEEVSGKPVVNVMKSWTEQMGFPLLTVSSEGIQYDAAAKGFRLKLDQEWFLADGSKPADHAKREWKVPIFASYGSDNQQNNTKPHICNAGVMSEKSGYSLFIPAPEVQGNNWWCKLNGSQYIPCRVLYKNPADLQRCLMAIKSKQMCPEDRCGMLNDIYALAKADAVDPGMILTLLSAYSEEDSMAVLDAMESIIGGVATLLKQTEGAGENALYNAYQRFVVNLVAKGAKASGWDPKDDDGHLGKLRRAIFIRLQCGFMDKDPNVLDQARKRFDAFYNDPSSASASAILPADYRTAVFRLILSSSDVKSGEAIKRRDQMLTLLSKATTIAEKKHVYLTIGSLPSKELKVGVLDWASQEILMQDFFYPFYSVSGDGIEGAVVTWEYFTKNFDKLYEKVSKSSPSILINLIAGCCAGFASEVRANEIEEFFKAHPVAQASRKVAQIVEGTRTNAKFAKRIQDSKLFKKELGL